VGAGLPGSDARHRRRSGPEGVAALPSRATTPAGRRIALLTPVFWPEVRRGSERYFRELADGLLASGHRPTLITSHRARPSRAVEEGVPVIRNWRPSDRRLMARRFEEHLTQVPLSYRSLVRGRYDVAHAVFPTDALAAARWGGHTGRPSVLSYMGIPDHAGLRSHRGRLRVTRAAVAGCDAVTVLSKTSRDAFWRWLGFEARVIHPGVNLDAFHPEGDRAEAPTFFCAAVPDEPRKRVPLLVAAFARVRREHPAARLVLLRPRDPRLARELASHEGVELVDPVEDLRALAELYRRSWVSVLPSLKDSFGIVLIESLACGRPVVASNADALPEVVDRDTIGRLFDGEDERALADALLGALELCGDPGTVAACRERAREFSSELFVQAYPDLYEELLTE